MRMTTMMSICRSWRTSGEILLRLLFELPDAVACSKVKQSNVKGVKAEGKSVMYACVMSVECYDLQYSVVDRTRRLIQPSTTCMGERMIAREVRSIGKY